MAASTDLNVARKNLTDVLGNSMAIYLQNLRSWFKQKMSREDFDLAARKMLTTEAVHLHNEFLLAILTKCQSLSSTLITKDLNSPPLSLSPDYHQRRKSFTKVRPKKVRPTRTSFVQRFQPADPLQYAPIVQQKEELSLSFCSRELMLPDIGMIHGRMLVTAWDYGLEEVEDDCVKLVLLAVEQQLKNILESVLSRHRAYRIREGKFKHGMSSSAPETGLRNSCVIQNMNEESEATSISSKGHHIPSLKPSIDIGQGEAARQLACSGATEVPTRRINLYDLLDTLQVCKSIIPSHTVYATNIERIINRLWHPSNVELQQEEIHRQEVTVKQDIKAQKFIRL